jgi:NUMOD3 motif-containing protein
MPATDVFTELRWIHFYLWRYLSKPIYVGQTCKKEPSTRAEAHLKSKLSFGVFLRENRNECAYEILDVRVWDTRLGRWACSIERSLIDLYDTWRPNGFNLVRPSKLGILPNGFESRSHTFEARKKISKAHKGRIQTKEWIKKRTCKRWFTPRHFETSLAAALLGRIMTRSEAAKVAGTAGGKAGKGVPKPGSGWGGKKLSEEHKKKISEGLLKLEPGILGKNKKGKKLSDEHRLSISEGLKRRNG